ncbi:hypothetical protein B4Q13_16360, partial [Lacticaseibacillus rhamnosus]
MAGPAVSLNGSPTVSPMTVAAMIGVWRAGCAYVPLDMTMPPARLRQILDGADIAAILTDAASRTTLEPGAHRASPRGSFPRKAGGGASCRGFLLKPFVRSRSPVTAVSCRTRRPRRRPRKPGGSTPRAAARQGPRFGSSAPP